MGTEIDSMPNTGVYNDTLCFYQFFGGTGRGPMIQLTQGLGFAGKPEPSVSKSEKMNRDFAKIAERVAAHKMVAARFLAARWIEVISRRIRK